MWRVRASIPMLECGSIILMSPKWDGTSIINSTAKYYDLMILTVVTNLTVYGK